MRTQRQPGHNKTGTTTSQVQDIRKFRIKDETFYFRLTS